MKRSLVAVTVEVLLGAVVDARDAHRRREERERGNDALAAALAGASSCAKRDLLLALAHLVVVVEGRDDLVRGTRRATPCGRAPSCGTGRSSPRDCESP